MRRKIVAGNWKMNGSSAFVAEFTASFSVSELQLGSGAVVILAPPAVYLNEMKQKLAGSNVQLASQNVAANQSGAYTGEVSASMLKDLDCQYCLVGHSERRALFGESDGDVVEKIARLLEEGLQPILCVGETLEEREAGDAQVVVASQVNAVLEKFSEQELQELVIAYEPVWAIGTGKTATPEQAQEMHRVIRCLVAEKSSVLAEELTILYGGSVNAANASALFAQEDIDGGLVGGASLKVEDFSQICEQIG